MDLTTELIKKDILPKVENLVRRASRIMLEAKDIWSTVDAKGGRQNFVTDYDKRVQEVLQTGLAEILPEALFMGEESDSDVNISSGWAWIVDPIDGTTNFIKGFNMSAISVALVKDAQPQMGLIYNPYADELFAAVSGMGARMNQKPIRVSENELHDGVVIVGTAPYYPELVDASFEIARYYFDRCIDIRRSGSCALDLCNVACGRAELYVEQRVYPWDYAAGALIVKEAGGKVTVIDGNTLQYQAYSSVKASNMQAS